MCHIYTPYHFKLMKRYVILLFICVMCCLCLLCVCYRPFWKTLRFSFYYFIIDLSFYFRSFFYIGYLSNLPTLFYVWVIMTAKLNFNYFNLYLFIVKNPFSIIIRKMVEKYIVYLKILICSNNTSLLWHAFYKVDPSIMAVEK